MPYEKGQVLFVNNNKEFHEISTKESNNSIGIIHKNYKRHQQKKEKPKIIDDSSGQSDNSISNQKKLLLQHNSNNIINYIQNNLIQVLFNNLKNNYSYLFNISFVKIFLI